MLVQEVVTFIIAAVVIGAVVFGGTTLAYFLGKRPQGSTGPVSQERRLEPTTTAHPRRAR